MAASRKQMERIRELRSATVAASDVVAQKGDDADALRCAAVFPAWEPAVQYAEGDIVRLDNTLYRVRQPVMSQAHQPPDTAGLLAVYAPIQPPAPEGQVLPWVYGELVGQGEKRMYNGVVYECIGAGGAGANIWAPDQVPAVWKRVG